MVFRNWCRKIFEACSVFSNEKILSKGEVKGVDGRKKRKEETRYDGWVWNFLKIYLDFQTCYFGATYACLNGTSVYFSGIFNAAFSGILKAVPGLS